MQLIRQILGSGSAMKFPLLFVSIVVLQACSGGSNPEPSDRVGDTGGLSSATFTYNGPVPANSEIQNFKTTFYDNVVIRCGGCHTRGGVGPTAFVDNDDVNYAWEQAKTVANLLDPSASDVVTRVGNGHNCWLNSNASCEASMTGYIERWAAGASQSVSTVTLLPRSPQVMDGLVVAPANYDGVDGAAATLSFNLTADPELMWMLRTYCSGCHVGSSATPQSPYFASDDDSVAYAAMLSKIDLTNPANSRVVVRLQDQHNCWSGPTGCAANAAEMQAAIQRFADDLDEVEVDSNLVISMAQILEEDGIIASGGGRFETDVIAKWEFREGEGTQVADTSGVQPEIPLTVLGDFEWVGGWGVRLDEGRVQGSVAGSAKLYDRLSAAGEYTIEAWVAPNNVTQEDAWIFGYAGGPTNRNTLLAQTMYNYDVYNRSSANPESDGGPATSTDDDDELAQATLQHVVVTYDPFNGRKIYVNGEDSGVIDEEGPGTLTNWSNAYAIVMGNDFAGASPWQGVIRMVAIHSRALTQEQIVQNYDVGVGQKYYLMFSVSELLDEEGICHVVDGSSNRTDYCYIVFQVSQFDSTAYLFTEPRFVNINPDAGSRSVNFNLTGIYLGMNGQLVRTGQGFVNIDTIINGNSFTIDDAPLQQAGTIVPLENGPEADVFFLAFENIDGQADSRPDTSVTLIPYEYPDAPPAGEEHVVVGMRTFDEINESFSHITGVPKDSTHTNAVTGKTVSETYDTIRRSLPSVADFQTFMASHQMSVMQLAAAYCDALVEDSALLGAITPALNFSSPPTIEAEWKSQVIVPMADKAYATGLEETQPTRLVASDTGANDADAPYGTAQRDELANELWNMINDFSGGVSPEETVKATCTAVLSSAPATMK